MTKDELLENINQKESMLRRAEQASSSLNKGKYKNSSQAKVSKIYLITHKAQPFLKYVL